MNKMKVVKISKETNILNPNYLGYDEDHNGYWNDYFCCGNKKCDGYNYLTVHSTFCPICLSVIEWIE